MSHELGNVERGPTSSAMRVTAIGAAANGNTLTYKSTTPPQDPPSKAGRLVFPIPSDDLCADSDEVARAFRDDVARCSDMMSPGVRCLAGG